MSALTPATGQTTATQGIAWPALSLPQTTNLSPQTQAAFDSLASSLQAWYSQVQGAVTSQLNLLSARPAAASPSTTDSTASTSNSGTTTPLGSSSNQITASELEPGILSADETGRALMAAQYLTPDKLKQGSFTADKNGRQGFAAFFVNAAMCQPDAYGYASTVSGESTAYVIGFSPDLTSVLTAYLDGLTVAFRVPAACAAGCTLDAGLGAMPIHRMDGSALEAGDLALNSTVSLVFNTALNNGEGGWQMIFAVPPVLPSVFVAEVALPAKGGTSTVAHGLGVVPGLVRVVAVLTSAAGGLLAGQEVAVESLSGDSTGTGALSTLTCPRPLTITVDSTAVNVRLESTHLYLNNSGTLASIAAGCLLKVYACSL